MSEGGGRRGSWGRGRGWKRDGREWPGKEGRGVDKTRFSLVAIRAEAPAEQRVLARLPRMPGLPSVTCSFCSSWPAFKFSFFSVSFGQGRFITRHENAEHSHVRPTVFRVHVHFNGVENELEIRLGEIRLILNIRFLNL